MGVYSWISHFCSCGEEIEFQTKSGPKEYGTYEIGNVPIEVARDIDGMIVKCRECGKEYEIGRVQSDPYSVPMKVTCIGGDDDDEESEDRENALEKRVERLEHELGLK